MVWRKSASMSAFLKRLAKVFRDLPPGLLTPDLGSEAAKAPAKRARSSAQ
jgi:LysR family hydrogen peroxide-inducible transcriptional activator